MFDPASKRVLDIVMALTISIVVSPILLFVAAWIRIDSPGPILFTQLRPGRGGKRFKIYKFRTMYVDAGPVEELSTEAQQEFKEYGKIKDDPRVTQAGKWIRKLSLDEFPQLINVLKGDMSIVGPRAFLEEQIPQIQNGREIFEVRPGITGLWQVSGRSSVSFDHRLELDRKYVRDWSLALDLKILIKTVPIVIWARGAY